MTSTDDYTPRSDAEWRADLVAAHHALAARTATARERLRHEGPTDEVVALVDANGLDARFLGVLMGGLGVYANR